MKILIIGYGNAGKRWERFILETVKQPLECYDSDLMTGAEHTTGLENGTFPLGDFDVVIIATPPSSHLGLMEQALDAGCKVIVEKPLCDLGQFEQATRLRSHPNINKVLVAYNYLYHPNIVSALVKPVIPHTKIVAHSISRRPAAPKWGFMLDNFSHTTAILTALHPKLEPYRGAFTFYGEPQAPTYTGSFWYKGGNMEAVANETIYVGHFAGFGERSAGLVINGEYVDTTGHMATMMAGMWDDLMTGNIIRSSYSMGYVVQYKLEVLKTLLEAEYYA